MTIEAPGVRIDESPFSASTTDNWVARLGGLPPYIRGVTRGVMKSGHSFTDALKIAIGVMHIWAAGKNPWSPHHTGHVTPATQAKATAALAHWEAMKAAAHAGASKREADFFDSIEPRDGMGMGNFVGESGASGASLFLPVGPSKKQDKEIYAKETAAPHRFHGDNLSSCDTCGKPITAAIHSTGSKAAAQPIPPVPRQAKLLRGSGPDHPTVSSWRVDGTATLSGGPHPYVSDGTDLELCAVCAKPIGDQAHQSGTIFVPPPGSDEAPNSGASGKAPSRIATTVSQFSANASVRHAGPDHASVSTGHIKGVPERHRKAAYATNLKNFKLVEEPLESALQAHFSDQNTATVNRLLGKRGGRMLKRAAAQQSNQPPRRQLTPAEIEVLIRTGATAAAISVALNVSQAVLAKALGFATVALLIAALSARQVTADDIQAAFRLGDSYGDVTPAHFPQPGDDTKTTAEPNTTSPPAEPDFAAEVADEKQQMEADDHPDEPPPSISPQEVFDAGFWAKKLANVLEPHLGTAATLGESSVKSQVGLPVDTDDSLSVSAVHAILHRKAAEIAAQVTATTAKHLAGVLQQGVANGEGRDAIAKRVHEVFGNANVVRAKLIAQNAVVGAYNEAAHTYAVNLPQGLVGSRVWLAHHDARTRDTHRDADGQERPLGIPYSVGRSAMMFPGQTTAPPHEWMNCRCSQAFLPPGLAWKGIAKSAQDYIDALHAKPPTPVSPYHITAA